MGTFRELPIARFRVQSPPTRTCQDALWKNALLTLVMRALRGLPTAVRRAECDVAFEDLSEGASKGRSTGAAAGVRRVTLEAKRLEVCGVLPGALSGPTLKGVARVARGRELARTGGKS